ncbi:hypothetical protein [Streptomyces luteogriseus]|uniref:LysM peptidoglycan-binding domain-containing protein n=1 Tax=Streptomyces luteogriseus TaxID=68233 RepID=UPI002E3214BC|nr:hypothetical protein [Streptomyces luteogriseus]WTJ28895.1 hypothetical protein OID52_18420 [Streptomyces luteogriseus]
MTDDWLSKLALRYLGDASRWREIYNANQAVIEAAAREHPGPPVYGTSVGPSGPGHWIFPGTNLTIPGATCAPTTPQGEIPPDAGTPPELPKVQWAEAAKVCSDAILIALGKEVLAESLKADQRANPRNPLVPAKTVRVLKIISATADTMRVVIELEDGVTTEVAFDAARAVAAWLKTFEKTPAGELSRLALAGKLLTPALYCTQAAWVIDQQLAIRIGAQIRQALGLPPVRQEGTQ